MMMTRLKHRDAFLNLNVYSIVWVAKNHKIAKAPVIKALSWNLLIDDLHLGDSRVETSDSFA